MAAGRLAAPAVPFVKFISVLSLRLHGPSLVGQKNQAIRGGAGHDWPGGASLTREVTYLHVLAAAGRPVLACSQRISISAAVARLNAAGRHEDQQTDSKRMFT